MNQQPPLFELTHQQRKQRVEQLIKDSERIINEALETHLENHQLVAKCVLYSGGNDSTVLTHLMIKNAHTTHAIHCNTTIGIEQTRQFVRETCKQWQLPLMEETAPTTYRQLVMEHGFPGPGHHYKMFQRLKERGLMNARRKLIDNPREQRVLYIAGRRKTESKRREQIPEHERRGSIIYASPLANWTKWDLNTYRRMFPDVPRNPVTDLIHMSGECLCGSFAKPGELEEIGTWFPEVASEIRDLETEVKNAGIKQCKWGAGRGTPSQTGILCSGCESLFEQGDET